MKNIYDIERRVSEIEQEVRNEFEVAADYYGDCYCDEIKNMMQHIQFGSVDEDFGYESIRDMFASYAKAYKLDQLEEDLFLLKMKDRWDNSDYFLFDDLSAKIRELSK